MLGYQVVKKKKIVRTEFFGKVLLYLQHNEMSIKSKYDWGVIIIRYRKIKSHK